MRTLVAPRSCLPIGCRTAPSTRRPSGIGGQGGYFAELMTTNEEVHESIRPLLKLSRGMISRSQKLDYALVSSLKARSSPERAATPAENCSGRRPDHRTNVGSGDWRLHAVLIDQAGCQLLRLMRRRKELGREGDADADFQAEEQTYPASTDSRLPSWRPASLPNSP